MKLKKLLISFGLIFALVAPAILFSGCCEKEKKQHVHNFTNWVQTQEPTCTEKGELRRDCLDCDYFETSEIDALGHLYGEFKITKNQTCTQDGEKERECERCSHKDKVVLPKLGHSYSTEWKDSATEHFHVCTRCAEMQPGSNTEHDYTLDNFSKCSVCGHEKTEDVVDYVLNADNQSYSVRFKGDITKIPTQIIIPDEHNSLPVTEVAAYGFSTGKAETISRLEKVTLGKNIKKIGISGFWGNTNLKSITFPDGLEYVGDYAFSRCSSLQQLEFKKLDTLAVNVFYGCTDLTEIDFGSGNLSIGDYAFEGCSSLQHVYVSETTREIGYDIFYNAPQLFNSKDKVNYLGSRTNPYVVAMSADDDIENYVGEAGTYLIARNCFSGHSQLKTATLGENLSIIDNYAFQDCSQLETLTLNENISKIRTQAFFNCTGLTKVIAPSVKDWLEIDFEVYLENDNGIDQYMHQGWVNPLFYGADLIVDGQTITDVVVPDEVTKISQYAFDGYTKLRSFKLGKNVAEIGKFAFMGCTSFEEITLDGENSTFYVDGNSIIETASKKLVAGCKNSTIADGVKIINEYVFLNIPLTAEHIVIADSVEEIGRNAFANLGPRGAEKEITMGTGLKKIGYDAFGGFNAKKVNVKDLASWCAIDFDGSGATPVEWTTQFFVDGKQIGDPDQMQPYYALDITEDIPEIKAWAFYAVDVFEVKISQNTTKIDSAAFAGTQNLRTITLDRRNTNLELTKNGLGIVDRSTSTLVLCVIKTSGVMDFSADTFEKVGRYVSYSKSMNALKLPSTVREIGEKAFCSSNLTSVEFQEGLERIEDEAFFGNTNFTSVVIPASVTYIGRNGFGSHLTSAHFEDFSNWQEKGSFEDFHPVDFSDDTTAATELSKSNYIWQKF